jgi:RND family efflux transporter MFP subunit
MLKKLFAGLALAAVLLVPLTAQASPMLAKIGSAMATMTFSPDPPQTGKAHVIVALSGVSAHDADATTVSFASSMPSMSMSGPSGQAQRTGPGRWEFDLALGMAAPWAVNLNFHGAVNGSATYRFVAGGDVSASGAAGMAGMSSSGNADGWRAATIALFIVVVIGALAIRRGSKTSIGLLASVAVIILALALLQTQYFGANPTAAMGGLGDMGGMDHVKGSAATPVILAAVQGGSDADPQIAAPGTVVPYLVQDVVARAPGVLKSFSAYVGDRVEAGQIIARLDEPELGDQAAAAAADASAQRSAALAANIDAQHHAPHAVLIAQSELISSQRDLDAARSDVGAKSEQATYWRDELTREKSLLDQGAVSLQEYSDERAQAAAASAALVGAQNKVASIEQQIIALQTKLSDARASVVGMQAQASAAGSQAVRAASSARAQAILAAYRDVVAPSDAVVVKRLVDPGVYVQVGTPIARIAVIDRLRIQASVAQGDLRNVERGTLLKATLPDGRSVSGRVTSVSPLADASTRTGTVEAIVTNPSRILVPGGFVQVTIQTKVEHVAGRVNVPSLAIVGSGDAAAVWADVNGTAHRVPVTIVRDDGAMASVTADDLTARSKVVVSGAASLEEGQLIAERKS